MKSIDKELARANTTLCAARNSHIISEINAASVSSTRVIPVIRTVQIASPQYFKTDPANFLALVQKLTGKKPAAKKPTGEVGSKKKKKIVGQWSFRKQLNHKEYRQSAVIERDSWDLEEGGLRMCDDFFELFGGFENMDFLNTLGNSLSTLPEFPMSSIL